MVVHRFGIYHSTAGASSYMNWFEQFTLNVNAALGNELTRESTTLREPTEEGRDDYYAGDFAFAWEEGKENLYQNFDEYASSYCDWHRIGYHRCTHDGPSELESIIEEPWTASVGSESALDNDRLDLPIFVTDTSSGTVYDVGQDYAVNERDGAITALSGGRLEDGVQYAVSYDHYVSGGPCFWDEQRDDGPVPDGIETMTY